MRADEKDQLSFRLFICYFHFPKHAKSGSYIRGQLMQKFLVVFAVLILSNGFAVGTFGQKVRLRSQITPTCAVNNDSKFADIYAEGNIAVMGSYSCRGAFIFDISNPDAPALASWYNPTPSQQFLEAIVLNGKGYFGSGTGNDGVHIVDLSNPAAPQLLGKVNSSSGGGHNVIHEMMVIQQNGGTYLIENSNNISNKIIKVINVTNPANPVFVRNITPNEAQWVHAMHIRGNRMYTSGWGNSSNRAQTEIWDISNLATQDPVRLGAIIDTSASTTAGNSMHSSWTSEDGNYLYSAREVSNSNGSSPGDIRVYNVSNPAQPVLLNSISMNALKLNAVTPHNPVVMGNKLYVSWYQAGLQVFDITDPTTPKRIGQYDTFPNTFHATEVNTELTDEPWDVVCGRAGLQNSLPTSYDGLWAVYPFLGEDKVILGDLTYGLITVDVRDANTQSKNRVSDFDGDGKTDLSIYHPSNGQWMIENSSNGSSTGMFFGTGRDKLVNADYNGDGKTDVAVWRPSGGIWYIRNNSGGFEAIVLGADGDIPVPGDFDADGKTDAAVFRPSNGVWYINQTTLGMKIFQWGMNGDVPVVGDFDGDGKSDSAVWRPSNGTWYVLRSSSSIPIIIPFGMTGDKPLFTDVNGDGKAELTVFRPSTGIWYLFEPETGNFYAYHFGLAEDVPIPADYDGDGKTDIAVFRPSANAWYWLNSSDGGFNARTFGISGNIPTPTAVQPHDAP